MGEQEGKGLTTVELTKFQKLVRVAVRSVVPPNQLSGDEIDDYASHYNCRPPPLFIIIISVVEVGLYHSLL